MKKLSTLFAIGVIAILLTACSNSSSDNSAKEPAEETPSETTNGTPTYTPHYIEPVTNAANLGGSVWFISKTYTGTELTAFNLDGVATSFTGTYWYEFYTNGEGYFDSDCEIVFKDEIDESTRRTYSSAIHSNFPNADFAWTASGNNITFSVDSGDPNNPTVLTGVLENSVLKITYPADIAQTLKIGNTVTTLNCTQCYAVFYTDLMMQNSLTSEASFLEGCVDMFGTSLTKGTDYTINGLNYIITDAGASKILASVKAGAVQEGNLPTNATIYFLFYNGNWVGFMTDVELTQYGFVSGTDYTITHSNTVVEITAAGLNKLKQIGGKQ